MLPRLPPPPIVPEGTRRGTDGSRRAPIPNLPPPPPIGTPPSARSTPPDSPAQVSVDDSHLPDPPTVAPPRSALYSSMPVLPDTGLHSADRGSGSGIRLALGAQRWTRKPGAIPSPLGQSPTPPPPQLTRAVSSALPIDSISTSRSSNSGKAISPRLAFSDVSRPMSPPGTPPTLSPRSPVRSPPHSPPELSPRGTTDWISSRPPNSPTRTESSKTGMRSPTTSPPRGVASPERRAGFGSPPMSPDRTLSPPRSGTIAGTIPNVSWQPVRIKPQAAFRGVFDDRSATLSITAPEKILHPPAFGVSLRQQTDKEKDVPTFLVRLVARIQAHEDTSRELYWIDSEFDPGIDNLQVSFSKDYPDNALSFEGVSIRTLAGLLKRYFMFLVEPLIPHEIYDRLSPLRMMHHLSLRTHFMGSVVCSLNLTHRSVIMFMLIFLQDILRAEYGITIDRLSRAFGMVFFRAKMAFPSDEVKKAFQQGCAHVVEMLITHADEIRSLDVTYSPDAGCNIVSASLQSLLYKLVDPIYRDSEFVETFLCCREYFGLTDLRLLERLIELLSYVSEERTLELSLAMRHRVFEVLQKWVKGWDGVTSDPQAVALFQQWTRGTVKAIDDEELAVVADLPGLISPPPPKSALRFLSSSQSMMRIQSILQLEPDDIAIQLTLYEFELLKSLPLSELLNKNFTKESKSPKWQASVAAFNRLASWVAQQVVIRKESLEARVKVLTKLIAVCEALLRLNNYNSLFAVLGGLNNPGVNRLTQSWEKVPKKGLKAFKALMSLFDPGQNYRAYRDSIAIAKPPFIPYLALLGKWLFAIEENNTSFTSDKPNLVNFDKMRNIYKVVSQIRVAREGDYRFIEHPDFVPLLTSEVLLTDDEIYERSMQCEARK